jgi:hypothetical protein
VRARLERLDVPGSDAARERARDVVLAAFADREPVARPSRAPILALVAAVAAAVGLAAASPPGPAVVDRVREIVGVERAQPALVSLPGGGRLLVASDPGIWVVEPNGKKRLLSGYREASWSPFGRFLVATRTTELAALEPDGDVRWTLARRNVGFPRWTGTETDTRIAYLTGSALRVVAGDGRGDRPVAAPVRLVAPAWRPGGGYVVTYVDRANRVVALDVPRRRTLWRATGEGAIEELEWSSDGRRLHVLRAGRIEVLTRDGRPWTGVRPARGVVTADAIAPGSHAFASAVARGNRSEVLVVREGGGRVFASEGRLPELEWSPDATWLLIASPQADQWVFVRPETGRIVAISGLSSQFRTRTFPRIEGWCCSR